jgi:hypothetical protein
MTPEQEIESDRDHVEDDGCPTEKAVLQRFWREHVLSKECYERGCAAYDDRVDEGVVLTNGGEHMKAFPNRRLYGDTEGMDLRDYFAAKAMQAMLANKGFIYDEDDADGARRAYKIADAMMKVREHG